MPLINRRSTQFSNFSRDRGRLGRRHRLWDRRCSRPRLELLEERMLLAVDMVDNNDNGGLGSLPYVIANSSANDTIEFDMSAGHVTSPITLTAGELDINHNLKIEGPGPGALTISAGGNSRVFHVSSSVSATISGLTITGGHTSIMGNGAGVSNWGSLQLTDDVLSGNSAAQSGGAVSNSGGTLSMTGCTVTNNSAFGGGGIYLGGGGLLTIQDCTIADNTATLFGGGGIENYADTLEMTNCTVTDNTSAQNGGGIDNSGMMTLINSTVAYNSAQGDGGGINDDSGNGGMATLANTIVGDNTLSGSGSGPDYAGPVATDLGSNLIGNDNGSDGFTQSSDLLNVNPNLGVLGNYGGPTQTCALLPGSPAIDTGNNSLVPAGIETDQRGFYRFANGTVDIGAFEVQDYQVFNTHDSGAGSLRSALTNANLAGASNIFLTTSGTITLQSPLPAINQDVNMIGPGANVLTVDGNGDYQVFVVQEGVTASIFGLTVSDGYSAGNGGGIENYGTLFLTDCAVSDSTTANDGGGIENDNLGTLVLSGCTVSGNSSPNDGGGIESAGTLTVINSTIAGNMASSGVGGGINNAGAMTLINSTVADNTAYDGGGIQNGGSATVGNTIVADNNLTGGSGPDFDGTVTTDAGNNLIGETDGSTGWAGSDLSGTVAQPLDPLLSALGNYGGPTETLALLPGSPAIDAGNNALIPDGITTDQRGLSRIDNGIVDIGAFECPGFTVTVVGGNNQSATVNTSFAASLVVLVTSNHGDPVAGGVVAYTAPGSGASTTPFTQYAITNFYGVASITATANSQSGSYGVSASTFGAPSSASFSLTNTAGAATKLDFLQQPTATTYGDAISPAVTVEVEDEDGNLVSSTESITIALAANPTSGTLGGTLVVSAVGGIATFCTLTVNLVGTGYTLDATATGLTATPESNSFNITARPITVTAAPNTKTYDGTTSASAVPAITSGSLVNGDTPDFSEVYSTSNAGTGLTLTPSGTVGDGNGGNNYTYTFESVSTGVITAEALTITAAANTKVYDGTTGAAGVPTITSGSLQGSDTADFTETYASPNAGTGLTLMPSGTVNDGNGGNNYTYTFESVSTGVITAEALTITAAANTKVYDGT
ncbi:MAG: beta strand repeat-containing protein, partial [Isosphaeraceae bacterium]